MNDDGTVRRSALPAIFNPEDLNALELALQIKDKFGGHITVISMGLPAASAILRDSLFRGADDAILITDARCAGSDTLATSYILTCAVKKLLRKDTKAQRDKGTETQSTNHESRATSDDIILCGRQAIDGDTAQVGPQSAEKLGIPQITYIEELIELSGRTITAQRNIGNGWQQVRTKLPVLLTVTGEANEPRVAAAKKMMKYKNAMTPIEVEREVRNQNSEPQTSVRGADQIEQKCSELSNKGLLIKQWDLAFIGADLSWCGLSGSPTKVHRIQSVVLAAKESKTIEPTQNGIASLIHELIEDKIIA